MAAAAFEGPKEGQSPEPQSVFVARSPAGLVTLSHPPATLPATATRQLADQISHQQQNMQNSTGNGPL